MRTILAALDASAAARPVLEAALGFARLTGAVVEAVHVNRETAETPAWLAGRSDVTLKVVTGPIERTLLHAVANPAVVAAALGARGTTSGRRPAGRTAIRVLERARKPILIVPPEAVGSSTGVFRRLLVPLEGTDASSQAVANRLGRLLVEEVEAFVLHVFTSDTMPRMLDRPARDTEMLRGEFLALHMPTAGFIEMRGGPVGAAVVEACREQQADLVVLSWSQVMTSGRAAVVRDVLAHSPIPVLLFPVVDERVESAVPLETARC